MSDGFVPLAKVPAAIEITRHGLHFDPPFHASGDTKPRIFWDAAVVQVRSDPGVTGLGSDMMLGFEGHEHLFVGQTAGDRAALAHSQQHLFPLGALVAARYRALGPRRQDHRTAVLEIDRRVVEQDKSLSLVRHSARSGGARRRALQRAGFPGAEDPVSSRRLARRRQGAGNGVRELERLGVYWIEEPLHRGGRAGMRKRRESVEVRIAGGDMTRELYEFRDLIVDGCVDVLRPDAER